MNIHVNAMGQKIEGGVDIAEDHVVVTSRLELERNDRGRSGPLELHGEELELLQRSIVLSHAAGIGDFMDAPTVRLLMSPASATSWTPPRCGC